MDLLEYLEKNSKEIKGDYAHRNLVRNIQYFLEDKLKLNIKNVYTEVTLKSNETRYTADMSVITDKDFLVIEAKVSRGKNLVYLKNTAHTQLKVAYGFFKERFKIAPRMFFIHKRSNSKKIHYSELKRPLEDYLLYSDVYLSKRDT